MAEYHTGAPIIRAPKFMRRLFKEDPECHKIIQDWCECNSIEKIRKINFEDGTVEFDCIFDREYYNKVHVFNELYQSKKDEYSIDDIEFTILYTRENSCIIAYTILLPDDSDNTLRFHGYILENECINDLSNDIVKLYNTDFNETKDRKYELLSILDNINSIVKNKESLE